jgi:hypothetical protein
MLRYRLTVAALAATVFASLAIPGGRDLPRWLVSFAHADQRGRISEATGSDLPSRA